MAILKLYNDEKVVELLNDEGDTENPFDSWSFDGNLGMSTDKTLFRLIRENDKVFWRTINICYDMIKSKFYINGFYCEDGFEIELNFDEDIFKYIMVDTEDIVEFQNMLKCN